MGRWGVDVVEYAVRLLGGRNVGFEESAVEVVRLRVRGFGGRS